MFKVPNENRIRKGPMSSDDTYGLMGAFEFKKSGYNTLYVIASQEAGWEHVSVSTTARTPTWEEMCFIKNKFWDDEDVVIQYHPPKSQYVNFHKFCLHMWRKIGTEFPLPPTWMIGPKRN